MPYLTSPILSPPFTGSCCTLLPSCGCWDTLSNCIWAPHCGGSPRALAWWGASEVAEVARGLSCSSARGTFLGQGLSLCLVAVELWHLSHWTTKEDALLILNKGERQGKSVIFHPCEIFLPSIQNARWHKVYIRVLSFWTACLFFMRVTGNFRDLSVQTSVVTAFSDPL